MEEIYNKLESLDSTSTAAVLQKVQDTYEKINTTGSVVTATLSELQELKAAQHRIRSDDSWRETFQCLVCRGYPSAKKTQLLPHVAVQLCLVKRASLTQLRVRIAGKTWI